MEEFSSAEASSEAGVLATWKYDDLKTKECQGASIKIEQFCGEDKYFYIAIIYHLQILISTIM